MQLRYFTALFLLLFTACGTFSKAREENLYQVHVGQSKTELLALLGKPEEQKQDGGAEKWYYQIYSRDSREQYPYTATFNNDKLTSWDFDTSRKVQDVRIRERTPTGIRY